MTLRTSTSSGGPARTLSTTLTMEHLSFEKVNQNPAVRAELVSNIKQAFLDILPASYTAEHLQVILSAGSVKATVNIEPIAGSSTTELKSALQPKKDLLATAVVTKVKAMTQVETLLEAGKTKDSLTARATDFVEIDRPTTSTATTTTIAGQQAEVTSTARGTSIAFAVLTLMLCAWTAH